jgi:hypothetical protein
VIFIQVDKALIVQAANEITLFILLLIYQAKEKNSSLKKIIQFKNAL